MKIDAECVDERGTTASVSVDLDYVTDEEEAKNWILQELYQWCLEKKKKSFDTGNFVVSNWNEVIEEVRRTYA